MARQTRAATDDIRDGAVVPSKLNLSGGLSAGYIVIIDDLDTSKFDLLSQNTFAAVNLSNVSNTDFLNKIKAVDGAGSGIDADLLDGHEGSYYLDYNNFVNTPTIGDATITISPTNGLSGGGSFTLNQTTSVSFNIGHSTSGAPSTNNTNGYVVQNLTIDNWGHVTNLSSVNLDSRFALRSGDTLTGNFTINGSLGSDTLWITSSLTDSQGGTIISVDNGSYTVNGDVVNATTINLSDEIDLGTSGAIHSGGEEIIINRTFRNFIIDTRYNSDDFTMINYSGNGFYGADVNPAYTVSWSDETGVITTNAIWYTAEEDDSWTTIDLSVSADPLTITVDGHIGCSSSAGTVRLVLVWHGTPGYSDITFEVKDTSDSNNPTWVEIPVEYSKTIGGTVYVISGPIYPTVDYNNWGGARVTLSGKTATSGYTRIYGFILYRPRAAQMRYANIFKTSIFYRGFHVGDSGLTLTKDGALLRIQTLNGYIKIGPENSNYCHFYTDRDDFYFNKPVFFNGSLYPYVSSNNIGGSLNKWNNGYFSGTVYASSFNGSLEGNASSATKWENDLTLSLTGDASGTAVLNGDEGAIDLSVSVLDSDKLDGYDAVDFLLTSGGTITGNLTVNQTITADSVGASSFTDNQGTLIWDVGNSTIYIDKIRGTLASADSIAIDSSSGNLQYKLGLPTTLGDGYIAIEFIDNQLHFQIKVNGMTHDFYISES